MNKVYWLTFQDKALTTTLNQLRKPDRRCLLLVQDINFICIVNIYNPAVNFCAILLAELRHVVQNRPTVIRQYTPSESIFAMRFCRRKETKQRVYLVVKFFNSTCNKKQTRFVESSDGEFRCQSQMLFRKIYTTEKSTKIFILSVIFVFEGEDKLRVNIHSVLRELKLSHFHGE